VGDVESFLSEALREAYPYLAEPRLIESLVKEIASRKVSLREAWEELDKAAIEHGLANPLVATDLRILLNVIERLLTSQRGQQLVSQGK
jgi:hypothetical protein